MKSKKKIYFLLLLVLSIWGMVAYRFFSFTSEEIIASPDPFVVKPVTFKPKDTSAINVNYRDPFLGKMYSAGKKKVPSEKIGKRDKMPVIWPIVIYKGIVSDIKDNKKIFMLIINGQTYLMKQGETENGITVKNGTRQAIVLQYEGERNTISIAP